MKSSVATLRSYYQITASEYDTFLEEAISKQETISFLSLIPENYHDPLLDVASGTGRISHAIASRRLYYVGLDISDSMLQILRKKTPMQNVDLVCGSATYLPFKSFGFPFLACFGLTGYFDRKAQRGLISEISRVNTFAGSVAIDFLRPSTKPSKLIRNEEASEGNRVYLLSLTAIRENIRLTKFRINSYTKTPRQVQFLLRKGSGKD